MNAEINYRKAIAIFAVFAIAFGALGFALADEADGATTSYTITFKDGDTTVSQVLYDANSEIVIPADRAKDGYTFLGWTKDPSASPVSIDIAPSATRTGTYTATADTTYTAVYKEYIPAYEFVVDGVVISTEQTVSAASFKSIADPSKDGYTFAGWSDGAKTYTTAADLKAAVNGIKKDTTFTAVWTPDLLTVTFTADGQTVATETVQYNALAVEPAVIPAKDGYDFKGWDFDFSTPITEDTEIKAVFTETVIIPDPEPVVVPDPATVIYKVDGLTVSGASTPAKEGYTFVGWSDGVNTIPAYELDSYLEALASGSTTTLTAVFEPTVLTVAFVSDGVTILTESVKYGELATLPAQVPTNMDFDHWDFDFSTPITEDTTVQAVAVVVIYYTVTFDYGYPGVASVSTTVASGETVKELPVIYPYMGDVTWSITTETPITADTKATLVAIEPAVPVEPETPTETEDSDSGVIVEVAVIVIIIAALAIAGIVMVKKGTLATVKAKRAAKKGAKSAGKQEPKP